MKKGIPVNEKTTPVYNIIVIYDDITGVKLGKYIEIPTEQLN